MSWLKKIFGKKTIIDVMSTEADFPVPFGYKTAWYAIKGETSLSVIEKLKLTVISEANWKIGLSGGGIFVSPVIDDYVLVIDLPHWSIDDVKGHGLEEVAKLFSELQYFGSHRMADYYAWAKSVDGKLLRCYSYVGGEGHLENEGELTTEELALGFDKYPKEDNFDEWTDEDWETAVFPDEESVIGIAQAWGIDPLFCDGTFGNEKYEKNVGYLCRYSD